MKQTVSAKSYTFRFKIERDIFPDGRKAFRAYIPELEELGGASWGYTKEEAIKNLQEVTEMLVGGLGKDRSPLITKVGRVSRQPLLTITT